MKGVREELGEEEDIYVSSSVPHTILRDVFIYHIS